MVDASLGCNYQALTILATVPYSVRVVGHHQKQIPLATETFVSLPIHTPLTPNRAAETFFNFLIIILGLITDYRMGLDVLQSYKANSCHQCNEK